MKGLCNFLLLLDVNEWTNKKCPECMIPHLNTSDSFNCSHASQRENYS